MKVIKKGQPQKGWSLKTVCTGAGNSNGGCGAHLLVEQADLFKTHSYVHVDHDIFITFKCVECGVLTDLTNSQKPPSNIRSILPDQNNWAAPKSEKALSNKLDEAQKLLEIHGYYVQKPTDDEA